METTTICTPPPPPPPPSIAPILRLKPITETSGKQIRESVQCLVFSELKRVFRDSSTTIITTLMPIEPVLQEGRDCGMAALSMAGQLLQRNVTIGELTSAAKDLKYTYGGEMFSAHDMASLASTLLDCDSTVVGVRSPLKFEKSNIIRNIDSGLPVLMPYDADKNHRPCLNNGQNAHWAVLIGFCFAHLGDILLPEHEVINDGELKVHFIEPTMVTSGLIGESSELHFIAMQGKSRHCAVWGWRDLLDSNLNLREITKKYPLEEMLIKCEDPLSDLRGKAILLKKKM